MAVDMFLKLLPIKGEAQDEKHRWEIELLGWSWGMAQTGTTHSSEGPGGYGQGGGSDPGKGKASIQDLTFTHNVDLASSDLGKACVKGQHFSEGLLTVRKATGHGIAHLEYLKIKLSNIIVTSVTMSGSTGAEHLIETVTLNFQKYHYQYTQQMPDGTSGAKPNFGWDIAENMEY